jgi:glycerol-3-phosphate dehydrogenase
MERYTEHIQNETVDVIVIGGGITGAAISYEAASRGLSVALFEKGDFSEATSAASSKLIHGGLRYLSNMEYGLVRESLRERKTFANIAPNFVYSIPTLFPHYRSSIKSNKWLTKIGLTLYDILAVGKNNTWDNSKRIPCHKAVSAEEALRLQPVIRKNGLTGASVFYDCISICPERLALSFIKSALHYGGKAANYACVEAFLLDENKQRVVGVRVRDLLKEKIFEVQARITINCAGPWADSMLLKLSKGETVGRLMRSEGIHIITNQITKDDSIVGAVTPGGKHCFLIPWRGHTLIGTTDKPYSGHPDDYRVTLKSIRELIHEVNGSFEGLNLTLDDVLYSYGGLRPLVDSRSKETYRSSRKYEIHDNTVDGIDGLLTVEGGKWTTSRSLAEKAINHLREKLGISMGPSVSAKQYLRGSEIRDMNHFITRIKDENRDFHGNTLDCMGKLYGADYQQVLGLARKENILNQRLNGDGELLAQAVYGVRREMARTLKDIVLRRTGIATLGNPGKTLLLRVAQVMARELNWDQERIFEEVESTVAFLKVPSE